MILVLYKYKTEWADNSLLIRLQENTVVAVGLRDPRCLAALEAMQEFSSMQNDPQQARARFTGDPFVTRFLQEFSRIMSAHFTDLHSQQQVLLESQLSSQQQLEQSLISTPPSDTELGPLHVEVLARHNRMLQSNPTTSKETSNTSRQTKELKEQEQEGRRAQVLLSDPVVREMLMDTGTQQLLLDCAHPDKLRIHLRDPDAASKIKQLMQLGLLKTM